MQKERKEVYFFNGDRSEGTLTFAKLWQNENEFLCLSNLSLSLSLYLSFLFWLRLSLSLIWLWLEHFTSVNFYPTFHQFSQHCLTHFMVAFPTYLELSLNLSLFSFTHFFLSHWASVISGKSYRCSMMENQDSRVALCWLENCLLCNDLRLKIVSRLDTGLFHLPIPHDIPKWVNVNINNTLPCIFCLFISLSVFSIQSVSLWL